MKNCFSICSGYLKNINLMMIIASGFLMTAVSCQKNSTSGNGSNLYDSATAYTPTNISYGDDPRQIMDVYLPAHRSSGLTKVFVLIHGGGWSEGDKSDFGDLFNALKGLYPDHAIVNLDYRLGTSTRPGYPKQINDIQSAIDQIQLAKYSLSKQYFLLGASAGGHLAMLYAYAFDDHHYVKGICNTVGPSDLTDPAYTDNILYWPILINLFGNVTYIQNPTLYEEVSPAKRVTPSSPPTISFYGDSDPLIPSSQMGRLQDALQVKGVYHEATMYNGAGHGNWNPTQTQDYVTKIANFINSYF